MTEVFPQNDPPNNHEIAPTLQQVFIKYTMESAPVHVPDHLVATSVTDSML